MRQNWEKERVCSVFTYYSIQLSDCFEYRRELIEGEKAHQHGGAVITIQVYPPNMTLSWETGGTIADKKLEKGVISHNLKASSMINLLIY